MAENNSVAPLYVPHAEATIADLIPPPGHGTGNEIVSLAEVNRRGFASRV